MNLEKEINKKLKENVLTWELFKKEESVKYPEFFVIALFIGLSLAFSIGGIYIMTICPSLFVKFGGKFILLSVIVFLLHLIVYIVVYRVFVRKIIEIERLN